MRRIAVVIAVLLLLAGCGSGGGPADRARADGAAAERDQGSDARVRAAVETMAKTSFSYHHTAQGGGMVLEGVVHRPSAGTTLRMSSDSGAVTEVVFIGDRAWGRTNIDRSGPSDAPPRDELSPWNEIAADTLAEPPFVHLGGARALVGAELFATVTGLHETAPRTYAGTIDISADPDLNLTNGSLVAGLGELARAVPMTVTLDDRGRITTVTIDVPGSPTKSTFADFDTVAAPAPPVG
ncbi:hypothetical protein [Asanoa iriomotensis]|uniref:Lipoprotein LprG n=2 Tax=Asanoa iriomotensis TaxID=234613 RepID=A0ABQ4CCU0_9ACTN|nr:hypothetical protein [Asanoa iriomotensis]GIF60582.1 hypothetical protein Air01nite_66770 [Asanoa iriomotensis]